MRRHADLAGNIPAGTAMACIIKCVSPSACTAVKREGESPFGDDAAKRP
jgi:hypothetical protein